jgi:hypothetical protein
MAANWKNFTISCTIAPGYQPAKVVADGAATAATDTPIDEPRAAGSPEDTVAARVTVRDARPNSRRLAAAAVHANRAAA